MRPSHILRALHSLRARGSRWSHGRGRLATIGYELIVFGVKQAWACVFGGAMLLLLLGTHFYYPAELPLARYDFLVIGALAIQLVLLATGMESKEEAKVILVYHVVGTAMEIFKTSVGSWTYPEQSVLRIAEVPLFSGFMYASVGSYIARVWRIFEFRFDHFPSRRAMWLLAAAIYANFYSHHFVTDLRVLLFVGSAAIFGRTCIWFRIDRRHRPMPLLLGFSLVALFIWFAENFGTYARAWAYPDQVGDWKWVSAGKLGSWFLLMIVSFVLVALVHEAPRKR